MNRRTFVTSSLGALSALGTAEASITTVEGRRAAISCDPEPCARAAARAIEAGGNAMDAAAAACLLSCMHEPQAVDLGGYVACAIVLEGKTGRVWSINADSTAPAKATPDMYRLLPARRSFSSLNENEYGCSVQNNANVDGALAVGVPGTLAGIGTLWERWGKLKWPQIVTPAQELLDRGFTVSPALAQASRNRADVLATMPPAAEHFLPGGKPLEAGQLWRRPGMEWTLRRLASAGWQDFYRGEIARRITTYVQSLGGILNLADMESYRAPVAPAIDISCSGSRIYGPPLANGGLTCLSSLLMLQEVAPPGPGDPMYWHLLAETLKLTWRDRLRYFGDPGKADIAWRRFLSSAYASERIAALKKAPHSVDHKPGPSIGISPGTIHISTADAQGNLVAITISHGGSFGSCVTVPKTGISLGHGMSRFDPHPGLPNSVAPGKRPLNNVCPTILRQQTRDVAFGLRGGRRIVSVDTSLAQQLLQGRAIADAVAAPRLHTEGYDPIQVTESMPPAIRAELEKMGHHVNVTPAIAGAANVAEITHEGTPRAAGSIYAIAV